jgi:hypothetical protein
MRLPFGRNFKCWDKGGNTSGLGISTNLRLVGNAHPTRLLGYGISKVLTFNFDCLPKNWV